MKQPLLFIQDTCRKTSIIDDEIKACDDLKIKWYTFGYVYFSNAISIDDSLMNYLSDDNNEYNFIVRSGTKIIRMVEDPESLIPTIIREKMKSGIWHSKYFDQKYLKNNPIEKHMLNNEAEFIPYSSSKYMTFNQDMFIKPSGDLKEFAGGFLPKNTSIESFVKNNFHDNNIDSATILISPTLHHILAEARFIVVDGKVISGSYYKIKNKIKSEYIPMGSPLYDKIYEYISIFEPAPIYSIDIALLPGFETRIVEFNCFNCSGLYNIDTNSVFAAIAKYVTK